MWPRGRNAAGCATRARCDTICTVGIGAQLATGRVIALGRLLLASLFLAVVWIDSSLQTAQDPAVTFPLLIGYVALAAAIVAATWNNWWRDAQLSGPAHAIDIALFIALVYLTEGDRSPFFTFFVFVLLSAAIRWGWRSTALTATLLTLLYLVASMVAGPGADFELGRFLARTGHLVILSLILIWFGVNQLQTRVSSAAVGLLSESSVELPTAENALEAAMAVAGATSGAIVWVRSGKTDAIVAVNRDGRPEVTQKPASGFAAPAGAPFLYDVGRNRALSRDAEGSLKAAPVNALMGDEEISGLALSEGLAVPLVSEAGEGQLYLEGVRGLSSDHLEMGEQIGANVALHMERRALMKAAEESAESRSRLAIARDLHDSVVQFLAGAAFRLEAMKRAEGRDLAPELDELKRLMLQEQVELRGFISALRGTSQIAIAEVARDLQALADRLAHQWHVQCTFSAEDAELAVPSRLHLDAQQLVREAVANAVRHAGAKNVSIRLGAVDDELRLDFINDGAAYPKTADGGRMPLSLKERVEAAGGALDLSRGMGVTKLSISLPVGGRAA